MYKVTVEAVNNSDFCGCFTFSDDELASLKVFNNLWGSKLDDIKSVVNELTTGEGATFWCDAVRGSYVRVEKE